MNELHKEDIRKYLGKPGKMETLISRLPLVPAEMSGMDYKWVVWFAGLTFDYEDMAAFYYLLQELGHIELLETPSTQGNAQYRVLYESNVKDNPQYRELHRNSI